MRLKRNLWRSESGFARLNDLQFELLSALEEGDPCPHCGDGRLEFTAGPDCSCHLNPPCSSCVDDGLICGSCDWRKSDGAPAEWYTEQRMLLGLDKPVAPERVADAFLFADLLDDAP